MLGYWEFKGEEKGMVYRASDIEVLNGYLKLCDKPLLNRSSTDEDLKKAYRFLSKKYHPDNYYKASEKEQSDVEEAMKKINDAYDNLTKNSRNQTNNFHTETNNPYDVFYNGDSDGGFFAEKSDYKCKKNDKIFWKNLMPEDVYVRECIESDLYDLKNYIKLFINVNHKFGDREGCFPVFIEFIKKAEIIINTITDKYGYTYETLRKLDIASIEFINEIFEKYKEAKFNKELSFGYCLINSLNNMFNNAQSLFDEIAFDCNFVHLIAEFIKITVSYEQMLDEEVSGEKKKFKNKIHTEADLIIDNYLAENNFNTNIEDCFSEDYKILMNDEVYKKLRAIEFSMCNTDFFDVLLNNSYFYNTYIDKNELSIKIEEIIAQLHEQLANAVSVPTR